MPVLPPLLVRLEADVTNFSSQLGLAQTQVQRMGRQGAGSFDQLATAGRAAFFAVGAAAVGVGAVAVKEALDQEAANARLTTSLHDVGSALNANDAVFQKAQAQARQLGFADEAATDSLAKLTTATKNPTQALNDLALAQNVARGRNIDLATATDILVKVETGHVALLGRIGINVKDATGKIISQQEALQRLAQLYGGQAAAYSDTFAGKMARLKAETNDFAEKIGFVLIPKIETLVSDGGRAIDWMERHATATKVLAGVIAGPLVIAMGAYVVKQTESLLLTTAQVALKLPQFFLTVGAAIQGTTASEVVLNSTTAATNATMAVGAGVVGLLALRFADLAKNQLQARSEAQAWAAQQVNGAGGTESLTDLIKKQQHEVDYLKSGWGALIYATQPEKLKQAEERLKALKDQAKGAGDTAKTTAAALDPTLAGALGNVDVAATSAADSISGLWQATNSYLDAANRVGPGGTDLLAQADATTALAKANQDLTKAQDDLNEARRQAPIDLAKANADAALAADDAAQKTRDLTVATEKYGVGSLEAKTAADQLAKSQADSADAAEKARVLNAAGERPQSVLDAEHRIADAKNAQLTAQRQQVTANEQLKRDQTEVLFSREKELDAINKFNTQYGTTLTLADAYNGKLDAAIQKQEQMVLDQLLLDAAIAATAATATQNGFVSDSPSARGKTVAPVLGRPLIGPPAPSALGGGGSIPNPYGPITINVYGNVNPAEISQELAFLGRARG